MKGLLKTRSALSQLLLLISMTIVSFVVLGSIGGLLVYSIYGRSLGLKGLEDLAHLDYSSPAAAEVLRAMQLVQFFSLFVIPCIICAILFSSDLKKYLGWKAPSPATYWLASVGLLILAIPFCNLLGELNRQIPFPKAVDDWMRQSEDEAARAIRALLSQRSIKDLLLNILFIAGLAAVGEELLFRGMAQRLFIKLFRNHWAGIIVSAAIFSAIHMQFYGFFPRLALGILLGAIYWYSGSLWAAMAAHFVYDAFVIVVAWFNPGSLEENALPQGVNMTALALFSVFCLGLLILVLVWMKRRSTQQFESVYADDAVPVKDHPF